MKSVDQHSPRFSKGPCLEWIRLKVIEQDTQDPHLTWHVCSWACAQTCTPVYRHIHHTHTHIHILCIYIVQLYSQLWIYIIHIKFLNIVISIFKDFLIYIPNFFLEKLKMYKTIEFTLLQDNNQIEQNSFYPLSPQRVICTVNKNI